MNNGLLQSVMTNVVFVTEFLVIIVASFLIAWIFEKAAKCKNHDTQRILTTRKLVVIGVFSAISAILYILDFPVFFAPGFYRMDFSELPALIGAFAFGPVTGVMIEFIKILFILFFIRTIIYTSSFWAHRMHIKSHVSNSNRALL